MAVMVPSSGPLYSSFINYIVCLIKYDDVPHNRVYLPDGPAGERLNIDDTANR